MKDMPATPESTDPSDRSYAGPERRRAPRRDLVGHAMLTPASGDTTVEEEVKLSDLSMGGVGFQSPRKYAPGDIYRISLKDEATFLNARLRIVTCRRQPDGLYSVGAELM